MRKIERDSFIMYRSFFESIQWLDKNIIADIFTAICEYSLNWKEIELEWIAKNIFILIKPQLEANNKKYLNWKQGWRPEKNWENSEKPKQNQNETKTEPNNNQNESKLKPNDKWIMYNEEWIMKNDKWIMKNEEWKKISRWVVYYEDEKLNEAFKNFVDMRKKIKKPLTDHAIDLVKDKLEKMYPNDIDMQILCINQSVENSWQWLFEVSENYKKLYGKTTKKFIVWNNTDKVLSLNELI